MEQPSPQSGGPSGREVVDVYLIPFGNEGAVFYSESPIREGLPPSHAPAGGPRGWLEGKFRSMQRAVHRSEGGMGLRLRRLWGWLQRRMSPDEPLLRRLRKAGMVVVHYPSRLSKDEACTSWRNYLSGRRRRHLLGLALNLAVTPLTLLLVPLPGPNVIGFWFVYRAVCHSLALLGIRRVLDPRVTTGFRPTDDLEAEPGEGLEGWATRIASGRGLSGLGEFLERMQAARTAAKAPQGPAS